MATTAIGSLAHVIKEELSVVKREVEPEVDPLFRRVYETSMGVERGIGRAWQVKHTFASGVAGAFKNVVAAGVASGAVDLPSGDPNTYTWATPTRTFPSVADVSSPGFFQRTVTLVEGMGSFVLPIQYAQAGEVDASLLDVLRIIMRGTAKNVLNSEADSFYQNSGTVPQVATILSASGALDSADTPTTITFSATNTKGRVGRFYPGMKIQFHDSGNNYAVIQGAGSVSAHTVTKVDYVNKVVTISGPGGLNPDVGDNDVVVLAGSEVASNVPVGPSGLETWMASSGSPFGISLTNHPQLKSLTGAVNGVMDGTVLNKYVGGFYDAYGGMYELDSLITTAGVIVGFLESMDGLFRFDVQGKRPDYNTGWTSLDYAWNGMPIMVAQSRYCNAKTAYICKMGGNNLKRYVPPPIKGTRSGDGGMPQDVQFTAPFQGSSSIFLPSILSSAYTEFVEAPFVYFREYCPDQMPGVILTGISESNP